MTDSEKRSPYRILTASRMWQSEHWIRNTVNVLSPEEWKGGAPLPSACEMAWRLAWRRKDADVVCTSGTVNHWYCLLSHLTPLWRRPHVMGELFLPEPAPASRAYRLKRLIRRILFRHVDAFVVYSERERVLWADYLQMPIERFHTVLFHTNILEPRMTPEGNYGFAAGKSERDFETFFRAVARLDYPFVVVASEASVAGLEIPENVSLHCSIPRERYLDLLEGAAFVVLPLHVRQRSAGQVVLLEGYALGKPAVASRVVGTEDYLIDGETGFFCRANSVDDMRATIERMIELPDRQAMGRKGLEFVLQGHTFDRFVEREFEVIHSVVQM